MSFCLNSAPSSLPSKNSAYNILRYFFAAGRLLPEDIAIGALDLVWGLTPGFGLLKDIYEARYGTNFLTGAPLSRFERSMAYVGIITLGYGSKLAIAAKAGVILKIFKAGEKDAEAVNEITKILGKAEEIAVAAEKIGIDGKDLAGVTKEVDHLVPGKVTDIYEAAAKNKALGKGSTGRANPASIEEQAALLVTRADPGKGKDLTPLLGKLGDSRWHANDGWVKMQTVFDTIKGKVTIHYVWNTISGAVDDFKFINNPL